MCFCCRMFGYKDGCKMLTVGFFCSSYRYPDADDFVSKDKSFYPLRIPVS